jgi:hypothetical protein
MDTPGFPAEVRSFCLAHAAGLEVLRRDGGPLDWVYVSPVGDFDHEGERTGRYGIREHGDPAARISYTDFALILLDEARPRATTAATWPWHRGLIRGSRSARGGCQRRRCSTGSWAVPGRVPR